MKKLILTSVVVASIAALVLAFAGSISEAQQPPPPPRQGGRTGGGMRPGGPGGGMRGQWGDPAQMREMMAQRFKVALACTDEEWEVIGPRLEKVLEIQFQERFARSALAAQGGPTGRGGRFQASPEAQALSDAIQSEDTPDKEIKAKLKAFRDAAKKREAELKKARDELRKVVTLRQEARLVLMSMLD
jgi:Spy/CpxP family protein refolding chaperone